VLLFRAMHLMQTLYIQDYRMQNNAPRNNVFVFLRCWSDIAYIYIRGTTRTNYTWRNPIECIRHVTNVSRKSNCRVAADESID